MSDQNTSSATAGGTIRRGSVVHITGSGLVVEANENRPAGVALHDAAAGDMLSYAYGDTHMVRTSGSVARGDVLRVSTGGAAAEDGEGRVVGVVREVSATGWALANLSGMGQLAGGSGGSSIAYVQSKTGAIAEVTDEDLTASDLLAGNLSVSHSGTCAVPSAADLIAELASLGHTAADGDSLWVYINADVDAWDALAGWNIPTRYTGPVQILIADAGGSFGYGAQPLRAPHPVRTGTTPALVTGPDTGTVTLTGAHIVSGAVGIAPGATDAAIQLPAAADITAALRSLGRVPQEGDQWTLRIGVIGATLAPSIALGASCVGGDGFALPDVGGGNYADTYTITYTEGLSGFGGSGAGYVIL